MDAYQWIPQDLYGRWTTIIEQEKKREPNRKDPTPKGYTQCLMETERRPILNKRAIKQNLIRGLNNRVSQKARKKKPRSAR